MSTQELTSTTSFEGLKDIAKAAVDAYGWCWELNDAAFEEYQETEITLAAQSNIETLHERLLKILFAIDRLPEEVQIEIYG